MVSLSLLKITKHPCPNRGSLPPSQRITAHHTCVVQQMRFEGNFAINLNQPCLGALKHGILFKGSNMVLVSEKMHCRKFKNCCFARAKPFVV